MKTFALLVALISFSSLGEILSARGMKQIGELSFMPRELLRTLPRMLTNLSLILGVVCMAVSFFSFLSLLSYADLSFVVPLTAVSYVTNTIGAKLFLGEKISKARWWGTSLVSLGVAFISIPAWIDIEAKLQDAASGLVNAFKPAALSLFTTPLFILRVILFLLVLAAIGYVLTVIAAGILWQADRRRQRALGTSYTPTVSIMIPVRGADPDAYENFASICRQDYPDFEVIFGCREEGDAAIPVIRRIQTDFPERRIELVISPKEIGTNAKISNLQNIYQSAKNACLLIVDSDIRVTPDYLKRVVAPLQNGNVGMVTCLYRGAGARTIAALLENVGISSTFGPEVMSSRALEGVKFALGSTIATRREVFEEIGGFATVADYLADDFLLGNKTAALGYEVVLSDYVVDHISGRDSMLTMFRHQVRWGRSTRIARPKGYAGLILTYGVATSLLLLVSLGFTGFGWKLLGVVVGLRLLSAFFGGVILMRDSHLLKFLWLVPLRDLLAFGIWAASLFGKHVYWRGKRFEVLRDGRILPTN